MAKIQAAQLFRNKSTVFLSPFSLNTNLIIVQAPLESIDENSPFPSPLPSYATFDAFHSKAPVPKLDLSKAKQIQEQYAKKLSQPQQQNYNGYNAEAAEKFKQ